MPSVATLPGRPGSLRSMRTLRAGADKDNQPRRLGRRPVLDGLRGIAVLLVIGEHANLIHNGFMGVDLFFVLSGFLITTLLCQEFERYGRISLKGFYQRRARRLLPALGLLALIAIAVDTFSYRLTGWGLSHKLATTLGFANNWIAGLGHDQQLGALNPTWSLAQEEQFYLLWPLALIACLSIGLGPRRILLLLGCVIAAMLLCEPLVAAHLTDYSDYYSPIDRGAELLLGCAGSLLWRHRLVPLPRGVAGAVGGAARARASRLVAELLTLGCAAAFVWLLVGVDPDDPRWVYLGAAAAGLGLLVLLIQAPDTLVGRIIALKPLRLVGRVSYCLYLVHLLIRNELLHYLPAMNNFETAALTLTVSLVAAALSYRYIEAPIMAGARGSARGRWLAPLAILPALFTHRGEPTIKARIETASQTLRRPIRSSA